MVKKRVVVTGLGLVTCIGASLEDSWKRILECKSGIKKISTFAVNELPVSIGGEIVTTTDGGDLNISDYIQNPKDLKKYGKFVLYGLIAAKQAVADSNVIEDNIDKDLIGVSIGSGIGGLPLIEKNSIILHEEGYKKVSPFFIPASLVNLISGNVSIEYGFTGPNDANVTACSTGAHSIANSYRIIQNDEAKIMVTGSAEGALCPIGIAGFANMRALSRNNDNPELASRPWDKNRDGFVMSDGSGILILEEYEHAKKRGAKIYAEILGFGLSGDANHIAAPHPNGEGAFKAMYKAMKMSEKDLSEIDYINAHGTSTPAGDTIELNAIKRLFGNTKYNFGMSSTKSSIGHALGAAGSIEAVLSILAIRDSIMPPTINLDDPEEGAECFNLVQNAPQEKNISVVMSNSFGFGGTNITLIIGKC